MKEWYEFNKEAIQAIKDNPMEAVKTIVFLTLVFGLLYVSLWVGCPC